MKRSFILGSFVRLALVFGLIWAALIIAMIFGWRQLSVEVEMRARAEADGAVAAASQRLDEADKWLGPLARAEAAALRARALAGGTPSLRAVSEGKPPILRFGSKVANGAALIVDSVADRGGGEATLYAAAPGHFAMVATTMTTAAGVPALDAPIMANSEPYRALMAKRAFNGPIGSQGHAFYAHLEPIIGGGGRVIGIYGSLFPLDALDQIARVLAASPTFAHGFLAIVDHRNQVLFRSATLNPALLERFIDGLSRGIEKRNGSADGYRPMSSMATKHDLTIVADVYDRDLTAQTLRLTGASFGVLGAIILLSLCLGWLMARRLTDALDDSRRSRAAAEAASEALRAELNQAARYVESLLPRPTREGLVAANWLYRPSVVVGGDAFGYHWTDETHFSFYLLDVCGHGVGAALLATTVMNVLAARTMSGVDFSSPASVLVGLNRAFPMEAQNGMYFTIWYGVYDTAARELTFAAAGHHAAVLVPPRGGPQLLQGKGLPIGCFENVVYPLFTVKVTPGARLYVFSDGIFEVELEGKAEMLTFEDFVKLIMECREGYADLEFMLQAVQGLQGKETFDDDCALLELEFRSTEQAEIAA